MDNTSSSSSSSSNEESKTVPSLSRKEQLSMQNVSADQLSSATFRPERRPERARTSRRTKNHLKKTWKDVNNACNSGGGHCDEDEKVEVEKKIMALQKIVPGGEELGGGGVDNLFEKTAGYILELQFQVKALKALASFVEGSVNQKMKLGG